jgi:peptidyl-prolyl isomerase E (cyclophilin E)
LIKLQLANQTTLAENVHKGFGFVEYELPEDCEEAIDNMHLSELYGKVIKVQLAKPHNITATSHRAGKDKQSIDFSMYTS